MKKYLFGMFAVVIALGLSAFSFISKDAAKKGETTDYVWHKYNTAGTAELSPVVEFEGTDLEARDAFDCPTNGTKNCGRAYELNGTPTSIYIKKP